MTIDEIIQRLDAFEPFSDEDPINDNEKFLSDLMNKWESNEDYEKAIPAIFQLIEKYPNANLDSPGPLVHSLETKEIKQYERELYKSLMKKPTLLTIWMYNRIINSVKDRQIISAHIESLKLFYKHPFIDGKTKEATAKFINYQKARL